MDPGLSDMFSARRPRRVCATWRGGVALVLLCLAVYLPGFTILPVVDRDEARFAQASRQMAESGDWVIPQIQGRPRLNKPPFIYWSQAACAIAFTGGDLSRDSVWMYRIPSLLAAISIVLLTWRIGLHLADSRAALLGAALLAVAPIMVWETRQARSDMVMVAFTTLAMHGLWRVFRVCREGTASPPLTALAALWLGVAGGILTKGPITPMVVIIAALTLSRITGRWRWLLHTAPLMGLVLVIITAAPWLFAVMNRVGADTYLRTVLDETLGRSVSAKEGHWGPPGYHSVFVFALLLPATMMLGLALWRACARMRRAWSNARSIDRKHALTAHADSFLLAWALPSWIIFECVGTKLPHYTLPLYPALALISARVATRAWPRLTRALNSAAVRIALRIWMLVLAALTLVAITILGATRGEFDPTDPAQIALALLAVVAAPFLFTALSRAWRARRITQMLYTAVLGVAFAEILIMASLPRFSGLWISKGIVSLIERNGLDINRPIAAVGFEEDSLIFETRGHAQRTPVADLPRWIAQNPTGLVVIEEKLLPHHLPLKSLGGVRGFNYSKGRAVEVTLAKIGTDSAE